MKTSVRRILSATAKFAYGAILVASIASVTIANAQSNSNAANGNANANLYYNHILPQQQARAATEAEIRSRPSTPIFPGEMRDAANYSAIAWYPKRTGGYGYVFYGGSIRDISASLGLDIYCMERKLACEGTRVVVNSWLAVGSHGSPAEFVSGSGETRAAAEAVVLDHCRANNKVCTIKDTFSSIPHPRGISSQRLVKVVR